MGFMTSPASDSLKEIVARLDQRIQTVDEERWLSSRYAPEEARNALIILYAFYYELARVRVVVTDLDYFGEDLDRMTEFVERDIFSGAIGKDGGLSNQFMVEWKITPSEEAQRMLWTFEAGDRVRWMFATPADSTALHISSPSAVSIARGFSQRIILPAFAAAMAISLCRLLGVQMSMASMSSRSMSAFQSVSTDS